MKAIADTLDVARSNLIERLSERRPKRESYSKTADAELLPLIREVTDKRPTYGYRRVTATLHREQQRVEASDHRRPDDLGVAHDLGDAQRRQRDASHDVGAKARFVKGQQALQHWQTPLRLARFVFVGAHGCPCTSAVTPLARASFALGLSASLVNSSVSFGSTFLRRKSLPLLTLNGSARRRATLMISLVFITFQSLGSH